MCQECGRHTGHADGCPNATLYDTYTIECALCGKETDEEEVCNSVCKDCLAKNHTADNAIKYGEAHKFSVKINGYLAYEFTPEQIESILMNELEVARQLGAELYHAEYLGDDSYDFADWLKGEKK